MLDLNWLIHPFDKKSFFEEVWQVKPTMLAHDRTCYFEKFFDGAALERAIEFGQPRPPSIRLASSATDEKIQVPFSPNGRVDIDKLRKFYLDGQTVILNTVEDFDPSVAQLARSIETEMGARVQVNAYLTPPTAQGFRPHYDTHDVLVVQIQGEKAWKIHGSDSVCPPHEMSDGDPRQHSSAQSPDEVLLNAGDVLYIPRGWVHEAKTAEVASLHLTFGIHPPLGRDLLTSALDSLCLRHPEFREALPVGQLCAEANHDEVAKRFSALVGLFAKQASVADAMLSIDDHLLRRGRSGGDGHMFQDMNTLRGICGDTSLEKRENIPCRLVSLDEGIGLQFLNGLIKGPAEFEHALNFVIERSAPFNVADLPGLEKEQQLALGRSLVADGLCRIRGSHW